MQRPGGYMDHRVPVGRASLEQDDLRAVLAQSIGKDAPRRPRPDDHVVGM